jgi:hypothetical protein
MKTEYYVEEDTEIVKSHAPIDLFKLMNGLFESWNQSDSELILNAILGLAFKLISNFQTEYLALVSTDTTIDLKVLCSWTNSVTGFVGECKDFIQTIHAKTKFPLEAIESMLSYHGIIRNFAEIGNVSFTKLQSLIQADLTEDMLAVRDHKTFNIEEYFMEWPKIIE